MVFFFFKQKTAYEMRISDWSSDVCSSDLLTLALDYASVSSRIQAFAEQAQFQLVETFAERLAQELMDEFKITWLRLKVTKPGAEIGRASCRERVCQYV